MSWRDDWFKQQRQLEEQRRRDREERRRQASDRLHRYLESLAVKWCLTAAEVVVLLGLELEWFGEEITYIPCDESA